MTRSGNRRSPAARSRPSTGSGPRRPAGAGRAGSTRTRGSAAVWWISPIGAIALLCPLTLLVAWRTPGVVFQVEYLETKSLTDSTVLLSAMALVAFAAGAGLVLLRPSRPVTPASWPITPDPTPDVPVSGSLVPVRRPVLDPVRLVRSPGPRPRASLRGRAGSRARPTSAVPAEPALLVRLRRYEPVLFVVTLAGYLLIGALAVSKGLTFGLLIRAVAQQNSDANNPKDAFGTVTGLTSLTQVGIAYSVVAALVLTAGRNRAVRNRLVFALALAALRSFLISERLAVIEVLVPVVVIGVSRIAVRGDTRNRLFARAAPLLLFPLLFVGFGALEYSRSYAFYAPRTHESLAGFTLHRLTGYYVTSYNNGQLALDYDRFPGRPPYGLLQGFWTAPGITKLGGYQAATGVDHVALWNQILLLHGNPEYNSPGGLAEPFVDLGLVGGFAFFVVAGLVLAIIYRRYLQGDRLGVLLYPALVTGMFELPRYVYWTEGRWLPTLAALLLLALPTRMRLPTALRRPRPATGTAGGAPGAGGGPTRGRFVLPGPIVDPPSR